MTEVCLTQRLVLSIPTLFYKNTSLLGLYCYYNIIIIIIADIILEKKTMIWVYDTTEIHGSNLFTVSQPLDLYVCYHHGVDCPHLCNFLSFSYLHLLSSVTSILS